MRDPILEAAVSAAEGNAGEPTPAQTWVVPESAQILLSDAPASHLLDGAVVYHWSVD